MVSEATGIGYPPFAALWLTCLSGKEAEATLLIESTRRVDARTQLRTADQMLAAMGAEAFAERARRELLAAGETVRKLSVQTRTELTAQETSIARLARDGQTNTEIGTQLFLSARTVEWHLGNVFTKLRISSRRKLRRLQALPGPPAEPGLIRPPVTGPEDGW